MTNKITVLLVDDHSLVRRGFRRILEDEPDMAVVGEAGDGEEAVKLARELKPRVVVMDCALPKTNGLEATRQILRDQPDTAVLMLSMHSENTWVRQAIEAGAKGYILKNAMNLELGPAVRRVANGETIFDPQVETQSALKGERNAYFEPAGYTAPLGVKDIRLTLAAAEALRVPLPVASLRNDRFLTRLARGGNNLDWAAIGGLAAQEAR